MKPKLVFVVVLALAFSFFMINIGQCDPGISVIVSDVETYVGGTDNMASYIVTVDSITTEDENVKLMVSGDPSLSFDWTNQEFMLPAWASANFPLEVTVAMGTGPGNYEFVVSAEAWPLFFTYEEAAMFGLIETSSYTKYVSVSETLAVTGVPEFSISFAAIASLALYMYLVVRKKFEPRKPKA